jgi:GNAT superfamily N-acetyltransferase
MRTLKEYPGPREFLDATGFLLEQQDLENNLILGNCYNLAKHENAPPHCYFLNSVSGGNIEASSIKVSPKVIVSGSNKEAVQQISDFYLTHGLPVRGVIGDIVSAEIFAASYGGTILQNRITFIQGLERVFTITRAAGTFESAKSTDLSVLSDWTVKFFEEEKIRPGRNQDEIRTNLEYLVKTGNLFTWTHAGEAVSMAAIIRRTKNCAVIGYVYTPASKRGNGFGKSCVHALSQYILNQGFRQSGLLVYESNSVARHLYGQLGYQTVSSLSDIDFK